VPDPVFVVFNPASGKGRAQERLGWEGVRPPVLDGVTWDGDLDALNELTRLMYKPSTKHEAGMQLLILRYGYTLKVKEDDLPAIWERAVEETRAMFGTLGVMVGSHTSLNLS